MERLTCPYGYRDIVEKTLKSRKHKVVFEDLKPHHDSGIFEPDFRHIHDRFDLRHRQQEVLEKLVKHERGRFSCPTGFGKSFLVSCTGLMWPKAKIDVIVPGNDLLKQMYNGILQHVPDVGLIGLGKHQTNQSITCISASSLHKVTGEADVVFSDECHQLGSDVRLSGLAQYKNVRAYGFSASHDARADGRDFEIRGFFGPILMEIPYEEAVEHEMVVPLEVLWVSDQQAPHRFDNFHNIPLERHGIWRNVRRNKLIAKVANALDDDDQRLIVVRTLEHAVHLGKQLPDHTLVYDANSMDDDRRERWEDAGLLDPNTPTMTEERRDKLKRKFENNELKKVIATTVWNTGVDFKQLAYLLRADASSSTILNTQIPGRLSRIYTSDSGEKKLGGTVIDFVDEFHGKFHGKGKKRFRDYKAKGWQQKKWRGRVKA
jgi:superfamily II DNA or RNA helicase